MHQRPNAIHTVTRMSSNDNDISPPSKGSKTTLTKKNTQAIIGCTPKTPFENILIDGLVSRSKQMIKEDLDDTKTFDSRDLKEIII